MTEITCVFCGDLVSEEDLEEHMTQCEKDSE